MPDPAKPAIQKTAYVYLPYGYDETDEDARYDILYLMHGWTMTAGDFFDPAQSDSVPMLDHMIENGDIPPVIVVCATFDAQNQSQGFSRSVEELSVFHRDLRENLIPAVESRYRTYAADVTERVKALASENNTLLGHFLCQGSIDLNRTAQRLKIPEGEKGHLSQERFERQKLSLGHPDEKDLADAREAVRGFFAKR